MSPVRLRCGGATSRSSARVSATGLRSGGLREPHEAAGKGPVALERVELVECGQPAAMRFRFAY
jgi:hypothetical protein